MLSNKSNKELVEAGHQFAKALDADMPLTEIAKLVSALSTRLDCAIVRGDELQQKMDSMAAENAALKSAFHPENLPEEAVDAVNSTAQFDWDSNDCGSWTWVVNDDDVAKAVICAMTPPQTPATDAYLNSVRAEGVDLVKSHPAISLVSLTHICDQIAEQLRSGPHDTADKAGAK
ncbi:hypothetical protein [Pantoea sp. EEL5]|uniref:hypothetical protein n=1 Tax=Pantoea sp. EEL5 TaxID=3416806 RepID=UPI003CF8CFFC